MIGSVGESITEGVWRIAPTLMGRWAGRGYVWSSDRNTGTIAKQHSEKVCLSKHTRL